MAGSSRARLGRFITDINYMAEKKKNCSISHIGKINNFRDITLLEIPYITENELSTANSFVYAPCRSQLPHRMAKFVIDRNSKL